MAFKFRLKTALPKTILKQIKKQDLNGAHFGSIRSLLDVDTNETGVIREIQDAHDDAWHASGKDRRAGIRALGKLLNDTAKGLNLDVPRLQLR